MEIKISRARADDIQGIKDVYMTTFLATFSNEELGITMDDVRDGLSKVASVESIERAIIRSETNPNERLMLVAKDNERVVGICECKKDNVKGYIPSLFILPSFQKMGIGKKLMNECFLFLKDMPEIYLTVESYNDNARQFYKKLGFRETGKTFSKHLVKSGAYVPEVEMLWNPVSKAPNSAIVTP
jgi:ribosomal protein S18 acetylase RimI-like enzyme